MKETTLKEILSKQSHNNFKVVTDYNGKQAKRADIFNEDELVGNYTIKHIRNVWQEVFGFKVNIHSI